MDIESFAEGVVSIVGAVRPDSGGDGGRSWSLFGYRGPSLTKRSLWQRHALSPGQDAGAVASVIREWVDATGPSASVWVELREVDSRGAKVGEFPERELYVEPAVVTDFGTAPKGDLSAYLAHLLVSSVERNQNAFVELQRAWMTDRETGVRLAASRETEIALAPELRTDGFERMAERFVDLVETAVTKSWEARPVPGAPSAGAGEPTAPDPVSELERAAAAAAAHLASGKASQAEVDRLNALLQRFRDFEGA